MNSLSNDMCIMEEGLDIIDGSEIMVNLSNYAYYSGRTEDIVILNRLLLEYSVSRAGIIEDEEYAYMSLMEDLLFNKTNVAITDNTDEDTLMVQLAEVLGNISNRLLKDLPYLYESRYYIFKWEFGTEYVCRIAKFDSVDECY